MDNVKRFKTTVSILSDESVDVVQLAEAVKKFGTVTSFSCNEEGKYWDEY